MRRFSPNFVIGLAIVSLVLAMAIIGAFWTPSIPSSSTSGLV